MLKIRSNAQCCSTYESADEQIFREKNTQARYALRCAGEKDAPITTAQFDLSVWKEKSQGDPNAYIRFTVTAPDGFYAATRAYRIDEL